MDKMVPIFALVTSISAKAENKIKGLLFSHNIHIQLYEMLACLLKSIALDCHCLIHKKVSYE